MKTIIEMTEERAGRWLREAEGYFQLAMLDPDNVRSILFDLALNRYESISPTKWMTYHANLQAGEIYRLRELYTQAAQFYKAALLRKPGDINATVGLGWCLKRCGQIEEAATIYEHALKHHPSVGLLHYNLACYQSLLGEREKALNNLGHAVTIEPEFKTLAINEQDFDPIRELPEFQACLIPKKPQANG